MSRAYTDYAECCLAFYELTIDADAIANFIWDNVSGCSGQSVLFIGSMFPIADALAKRGLKVSVVDYSEEMVALGRQRLSRCTIERADLKSLRLSNTFDHVLVVGRVFTHMISDADVHAALTACDKVLNRGGSLFVDNYEAERVQATDYFNGTIEVRDETRLVRRRSRTELVTASPYVVNWHAEYSGHLRGKDFKFTDSIFQRAFSRQELAAFLNDHQFIDIHQGDNFDETSFYTVGRAAS